MEFLGWHYYATALDQSTVRSIIPMPSPTLYDLETSVAQVASTAAWAVKSIDAPVVFRLAVDRTSTAKFSL